MMIFLKLVKYGEKDNSIGMDNEGSCSKYVDLLDCEELTILNAIPTVEGTIKIVLEEREETIYESNVLICGFGRIGKILCNRFKSLGADVYCVARREADLAWIREGKYVSLKYDEICEYASEFDVVINTVPSLVITEKELATFNKDVLIVDVASNPGGIDKEYALSKNIKVITALGIPGKEFPKTAAKYIQEVTAHLVAARCCENSLNTHVFACELQDKNLYDLFFKKLLKYLEQ